MDLTPTMDPDSQAGLPPRLEVQGVRGISEVSVNPVVLWKVAQSGVYRQSVVLKLAGPPRPGSYLIPLRVRLSLSDGSAEFSAPLSIRLEGP